MRSVSASFLILLTLSVLASKSIEEIVGEVWIDGTFFYKPALHKKKPTIYFQNWDYHVQQFLEDDTYNIALQLTKSFDPLPNDQIDLPNITFIGAISDQLLMDEYLHFLERFGRTMGVNYMVLPDSCKLTTLEKKVLIRAKELSPFYFLEYSYLSRQLPVSKKEFKSQSGKSPKIWLSKQNHNLKRIRKWLSRKKLNENWKFTAGIRASLNRSFEPIYGLPEDLKKLFMLNGAIAIDPQNRLPLKSKEVYFVGDDPNFSKWLSKYAEIGIPENKNAQRIVDLRKRNIPIQKGDIVLTNRLVKREGITQILIPLAYKNMEIELCKMIFGGVPIKGLHREGRIVPAYDILSYSSLECEGFDTTLVKQLDSLSQYAISHYATPGIQLAVVKNGSLVLEKSYGYFSYDSLQKVTNKTLYDLASLTKVMATLPAIAYLVDRKRINLDDSISQYLPAFAKSDKASITIRQLLAHYGGLKSYVPFWRLIMDDDKPEAFCHKTQENATPDKRSYGFKPSPQVLDSLKRHIIRSKLIEKKDSYQYSDLGFMILHMVVEKVTAQPFDEFLAKTFYDNMELERIGFNPLARGILNKSITPTEYDQWFRDYQVIGEVHDRNAVVFGGVAGHAGLFSNAEDLAKLMYMLMNDGRYKGHQYISADVLNEFNIRHFKENRRGLGWDKKGSEKEIASKKTSDESFGHTGFTGTMVWADPKEDMIFVFLSNRIYSGADNWRLNDFKIRTRMHDFIYEAMQ